MQKHCMPAVVCMPGGGRGSGGGVGLQKHGHAETRLQKHSCPSQACPGCMPEPGHAETRLAASTEPINQSRGSIQQSAHAGSQISGAGRRGESIARVGPGRVKAFFECLDADGLRVARAPRPCTPRPPPRRLVVAAPPRPPLRLPPPQRASVGFLVPLWTPPKEGASGQIEKGNRKGFGAIDCP